MSNPESSNPVHPWQDLPDFPNIDPAEVLSRLRTLLAEHRAELDRLAAVAQPSWERLLGPLEAWQARIDRLWSPVAHLHGVQDSPALREIYAQGLEALSEHQTALAQHPGLYRAVRSLRDSAEWQRLAAAQRAVVEDLLLEFRLSGVALPQPQRQRLREIECRLARLASEFEQALLDATEAWYEDFDEVAALRGLPPSALDLAQQLAAAAGRTGWRINLQGPSYQSVITHADDRALRERIYRAHGTRASDQGPHAGRFDNSARMEEILRLRQESARLLGFANAAEVSLASKMAPDTASVLAFLEDLVARARPVAERELAELEAFAAETLGLEALEPWDIPYAAEKLRQARHALSEEDLRPYFPLPSVLAGMLDLAAELFGLSFRPREGLPVWHPEVGYYEVYDASGQLLAGFYLDLYARNGKRGGAWMDSCQSRFRHGTQLQHPVAFLCCNFAPPAADKPSLLSHDEVLTLFHEFGHGLHHMLTEVDWPSVAGINGVEWDAVELPSQFMENFAWNRRALDRYARHWQTGAPLPEALYQRMLEARHFHAGLSLLRQLEFALFDLRLHRDYDPAGGPQVQAVLEQVRREVAIVHPPAWQRFAHGFGHIFAGGYAAGYYSYLWAERLSADAFELFEQHGVIDPRIGRAFRSAVLAVGGSRPALESFIAFRGREPRNEALLRSHGLAA